MNQEQLLDHVAELLKSEAEKGPGTLLLIYCTDYYVLRIDVSLKPDSVVVNVLDASKIATGLPPSEWLALAKKIWAIKSSFPGTIKFPPQPPTAGGKHKHTPIPGHEDPITG